MISYTEMNRIESEKENYVSNPDSVTAKRALQ